MTPKMNKSDTTLEPDSPGDDWFLSSEWASDQGALIEVTVDARRWDAPLVNDLKIRGPAILDHVAERLLLDPKIVSLFLCDDEDMRAMNNLYRGFDKATNVLSFPAGDMLADEINIGDIAIASEAVIREASEAGIAESDHLLHLFTHGVLHLLGYDHEDDAKAAEMEGMEIELLDRMKVANPYLDDDLAFGVVGADQ